MSERIAETKILRELSAALARGDRLIGEELLGLAGDAAEARISNQAAHLLKRITRHEGTVAPIMFRGQTRNGSAFRVVKVGRSKFTCFGDLAERFEDLVGKWAVVLWADTSPPAGHRNIIALWSAED